MKYKSYRIVNGKTRWVTTDENEKIINKNPSRDELKGLGQIMILKNHKRHMINLTDNDLLEFLKLFYRENGEVPTRNDFIKNSGYPSFGTYVKRFGSWSKALELASLNNIYNETNTCDRCGKYILLGPGNPRREYNTDGSLTGKWLCGECGTNDLQKKLADSRTGNLNPYSSKAKGDILEEVTCKVHGVKNLNIEDNNFTSSLDHSRDPKYGILQTKGAIYDPNRKSWHNRVNNEHGKDFDNIIFYCISRNMKNIDRIYIIPWEEIYIRKNIEIIEEPSKGGWYEEYRIDEKPYNDAYHKILNGD